MYRWTRPLIAGLATLGPVAAAHHSIAGVYDSSRETTVEGVVTEFHFVRPHPFLILDVSTATAAHEPWRVEMDNHFELRRIGIAADTFEPGDRVLAIGNPGREQAATLYLRRLDRPSDGLRYKQINRSPSISFEAGAAGRQAR